jgi:hypothetical protein
VGFRSSANATLAGAETPKRNLEIPRRLWSISAPRANAGLQAGHFELGLTTLKALEGSLTTGSGFDALQAIGEFDDPVMSSPQTKGKEPAATPENCARSFAQVRTAAAVSGRCSDTEPQMPGM